MIFTFFILICLSVYVSYSFLPIIFKNFLSDSISFETERQNTLIRAKRYIEKGEYDRAMDLLDTLLIKNADDKEAFSLMEKVINMKAEAAAVEEKKRQQAENDSGTNALQQTLEDIAKANQAAAEQNAAMQRLLQEQAEQEKERQNLLKKQAEQEAERQKLAEKRAAEEQKKKEKLAAEERAIFM